MPKEGKNLKLTERERERERERQNFTFFTSEVTEKDYSRSLAAKPEKTNSDICTALQN
jgi:hypothetical protein